MFYPNTPFYSQNNGELTAISHDRIFWTKH